MGALPVVASVLVIVIVPAVAPRVVIDEWQVVDYTCTPVVIVALNQVEIVA